MTYEMTTRGGIYFNHQAETSLKGLYAAGDEYLAVPLAQRRSAGLQVRTLLITRKISKAARFANGRVWEKKAFLDEIRGAGQEKPGRR